jgi:Tfp pilus assembly protein PilF
MGAATGVRRGREFMDACFLNVHNIMRKPGVKELKDIFKGCTAIVVSAGPSLDKNVHLLRKAKGKAVIIASSGSLFTLLSCDVVPDVIVDIDPVKENIEDKFQGNPELKNVPFICLDQYTPELVNIYPGPLFINTVPGNLVSAWLKNHWDEKGIIECFGGSVAHLAFATAEYIGAEVIAFVGQDLSYKSDRIHTAGYSDDLDRRLENAEGKKQENVIGEIPVRDIFNEEVFSIPQFMTFKTSFENRIKGSERVVINATEEGLPIEGATNMRLMDFIDEYCACQKGLDTFSVLLGVIKKETHCNIDGLMDEVIMVKKKYESIKKASIQILKNIKVVKKLKGSEYKDSPELNRILSKVQKLIEKVKHPSLDLLVGYNYGLELYMKKQEIQDIDEMDDKWEMLDKQLERGQLYYNEIVKTITPFNKTIGRVITALKREKKVDATLTDDAITEKERFYRAGKIYKEAGLAARAAQYLEPIVKEYDNHNQKEPDTAHEIDLDKVYIALAEIYLRQFRYYDAKETLDKIKDQRLKYIGKADLMLKRCDQEITVWEGSKMEMRTLFRESEENYGSHLESGYFYFKIKDFERAEKAYHKVIEKNETGLTEAYYGLAHTYLERNNPEEAVSALERAIGIDPLNPILYRDLGFIAAQSNNIEPAEIFFAKAIELAPEEAGLYKPLANLYVSLGENERAVALYENAIQAHADNPAFQHDLALIYQDTVAGIDR